MATAQRVVSLVPAATEMVAALGMLDVLVGVSHECDYPSAVRSKPRITRCEIHDAGMSSLAIDTWVREKLHASGTLYEIDEPLMRSLAPDTILTQRLCDVCAVAYGSVARFAGTLPGPPNVVNLEPQSVEDIFADIRKVADALGVPERADSVVAGLSARVESVRRRTDGVEKRRCVVLEWLDPIFCSGHWCPEIVEMAGGVEPLGRRGTDSVTTRWDEVVAAKPDVIILACCGYSVERTLADYPILRSKAGFADLPAVKNGEVYAVDGSAYFSRPGPRVVDSLEILAVTLHPELFAGAFPDRGIVRVP